VQLASWTSGNARQWNLRQPLQNVDRAEIGGDEGAVARDQEGADRAGGESPLGGLDPPAGLLQDSREPV
jgi:hypothetical protein